MCDMFVKRHVYGTLCMCLTQVTALDDGGGRDKNKNPGILAEPQLRCTCRKAAYLSDGIVKSGIVNNSGLGDGRLRPCAV